MRPTRNKHHLTSLLALIPGDVLAPRVHGPACQLLSIIHDHQGMKFRPDNTARQRLFHWRIHARALFVQLAPRFAAFDDWCRVHAPPASPEPPFMTWSEIDGAWLIDGAAEDRPEAAAKLMAEFLDIHHPKRPLFARKQSFAMLYPHGITSAALVDPNPIHAGISLGIVIRLEMIPGTREILSISTDRPCVVKWGSPDGQRLPFSHPVHVFNPPSHKPKGE